MGRFGDPVFVTVDSGQTTSTQFFIGGGPEKLTVIAPSSRTGGNVFFQVAAFSGGPFARMQKTEVGTDYLLATSATEQVAATVFPAPPGTYGRLETSAATTLPGTFTVIGGVGR